MYVYANVMGTARLVADRCVAQVCFPSLLSTYSIVYLYTVTPHFLLLVLLLLAPFLIAIVHMYPHVHIYVPM